MVDCRLCVGASGIVLVIGNGICHGINAGIDLVVRIRLDGNLIIAGLQHVAAGALLIVGSHVLCGEADGHGLGSARLQQLGLVEGDQVGAGLLDTAVGVGRVVINLNHILAGHSSGIGHSHIKADGAVLLGQIAHLLGEAGIGQAVAEGIHHCLVIIDQPLVCCRLIEAVAHIDALHIVDEGGQVGILIAGMAVGSYILILIYIVINEAAEVVPGGCLCQVADKGVHSLAGGVDLAGNDFTEGLKSGLTGTGAPDGTLDLTVLVNKAQLHGVGTVVNQNYIVKIFTN